MLKAHWDKMQAAPRVSFPDMNGEIAVGNIFTIVSQTDAAVSKRNRHKVQEEQVGFLDKLAKSCHIATM